MRFDLVLFGIGAGRGEGVNISDKEDVVVAASAQ
jgi:hypothetical protein